MFYGLLSGGFFSFGIPVPCYIPRILHIQIQQEHILSNYLCNHLSIKSLLEKGSFQPIKLFNQKTLISSIVINVNDKNGTHCIVPVQFLLA